MSTGAPSTDLLQIDDQLTDEERLIRDSVRAFVERPGAAAHHGLVRGGPAAA